MQDNFHVALMDTITVNNRVAIKGDDIVLLKAKHSKFNASLPHNQVRRLCKFGDTL